MKTVEIDNVIESGLTLTLPDGHIATSIRGSAGEWDPIVVGHMRKHLQSGWAFVDVGAHVGVLSAFASRLVMPGGFIVAFEPRLELCALLQENLSRHMPWDRFCVIPAACGIRTEAVRFAVNHGNNEADNRTHNVGEVMAGWEMRTVPALRLGNFPNFLPQEFSTIVHHVFLKIDAQWAEVDVLEGLIPTDYSVSAGVVEIQDETRIRVKELLEDYGFHTEERAGEMVFSRTPEVADVDI